MNENTNMNPPMYEVKIRTDSINIGDGTGLLAFVDIIVCSELKVRGFTIRAGENGAFVGRPGKPDKNGKWYDQTYPITKEGKERLDSEILQAYAKYQSEHRGAYIVESSNDLIF